MPDRQVRMYRVKAIEVAAIKLSKENAHEVATWCGGLEVGPEINPETGETFVAINIPTLEGNMRASEGDYVVRGMEGNFYPVGAGSFETTFTVNE